MKMSVNPVTGKAIDNKRRLVFNETSMTFIPLARKEKVIRDPLNPSKLSVGQKLLFDPLQGKYLVTGGKLVFDPLQGKYIVLQKGEKLRFDPLCCKFAVVRRKRRS